MAEAQRPEPLAPSASDLPRTRPSWRVAAASARAPIITLLFLIAGGVLWLAGERPLATRVWFVGLVLTGASPVWRTLREATRGHLATDLVATLAIVTAVLIVEPFAGLVIVLMQTGGEALERAAAGRASAALRELEEAAPRMAHRQRDDGAIDDVAAEDVRVGDLLLVRPGELIPTDAVVVSGRSHIDTSRITGEPLPVSAVEGTRLLSGSANGESPLVVRATAPAGESQYARIVELVRSAQASKAPLQRLADRYAVWFTPATLVVCAAAWLLSRDVERVLAVLVVATPCPLILATPIAIIGGINRAAARQIIVRHGGALEQLAAVTAVVFDKTGTLTIGRPEVQRVLVTPAWSEARVLRLAGAVEEGSGHLLARSLVEAALGDGSGPLPAADGVVEAPGQGVSGTVDGVAVTVGARAYVLDGAAPDAHLEDLELRLGSTVGLRAYVAVDGRVAGIVEYADRLRAAAPTITADLHALGVRRTVLLSGDHAPNVLAVAKLVGIDVAHADLLPNEKVEAVHALRAEGETVAMIGDGVNDAPALSSANVGIALAGGAREGAGIAAEAADVVLLSDDLARIPEAIRISRRSMRIARQSLGVGLGLSTVAMGIAAFGYIPPAAGALVQEAIDVAVILNALRARS
jgi:heavy metal translocating P-type ATPase